jgi:two-component system, OmpR family, response regulator
MPIRSFGRRTGSTRPSTSRSKARFAGWNLDLASGELFSPSDKEVPLTTSICSRPSSTTPNQVLTRGRLLDLARHREAGPEDRTIDVQVLRLRRKLRVDPKRPTMIKTVRGRGYKFIAEVRWL